MSYKPQRRQPPRMRHDPLGKQISADPGYLSTKKLQGLNNSDLIHPELDNPETVPEKWQKNTAPCKS